MTATAQEALASIRALRRITKETGTFTRRAQSKLLASLPDEVLTEVAKALATEGTQETTDRHDVNSR
jgi:hypothetical protein